MKNTRNLFLLLIFPVLIFSACKGPKTASQAQATVETGPVLLGFDKENVSKEEFERVYAKNNGGKEAVATHTPEQFREYLDLYINFKRKVFEAETIGLDTTPAFQQEFNTYRKQLAQPYLSSKEVEDELIKEAYDRSAFLVNASHLLVNADQSASPEDTAKAFARVMAYRDSIVNFGKNFGDMAEKYSDDPSAKSNKGNLGFFSAFDMVYPFESAAYNTPVGQVSQPVRTRFGYHLLFVHDKIASTGTKKVAHIIVRVGERYSSKTEEQAEKRIREIYDQLKAGADFAQIAAQYSDDPSSSSKGGDLGTGRLLPEMENLKLQLAEGEFSEPFTTRFGWHILKVTEEEKRASFEESRNALKQKISRDSRAQISRNALIEKIKKENNYALNSANFDEFKASLDESFLRGVWKPDTAKTALYQKPLFTLGKTYTQPIQEFVDYYVRTRSRRNGMSVSQAADEIFNAWLEQELLKYEEEQLPNKNPDFRHLLKEYRDGILLFTLMEQKVWKKAVEDTTGLKKYYLDNQTKFHAGETVDVKEYRTTDEAAINEVKKLLAEGKSDAEIEGEINQTSALKLSITSQTYEKEKDQVPAELFSQPVGYQTETEQQNNFYRILVSTTKNPAGIQPFEKVKSQAITQYQDYLEQQWLVELAQKYPVKINESVFNNLFK
ncbi:MAG: peptidylprolyl isomerase [Bacteroidia bacterium]|nr:peptidylprolyl isomerase [Bacteroidia bacterium]